MKKLWIEGPKEILNHAIGHFEAGTPSDLRFALISIDNAIEVAIKAYLRYEKGLTRGEVDKLNSFHELLRKLQEKLDPPLEKDKAVNIVYFHDIRNDLYHNGNGMTVSKENVETALNIAYELFDRLFRVDMRRVMEEADRFYNYWNKFQENKATYSNFEWNDRLFNNLLTFMDMSPSMSKEGRFLFLIREIEKLLRMAARHQGIKAERMSLFELAIDVGREILSDEDRDILWRLVNFYDYIVAEGRITEELLDKLLEQAEKILTFLRNQSGKEVAMEMNQDFLKSQEHKAAKGQEKASKMNDSDLEVECRTIQDFLLSNIYPQKFSDESREELRNKARSLGYKLTTRFDEWWEKQTGQEWTE